MRRVLVLTGGALIAAATFVAGLASSRSTDAKPSKPPTAMIPGAPLVTPEPVKAEPAPTGRGANVLLDKIERVGDHYEAPLSDGKRATLTLDPDLQTLAEKLLDEARAPRGAIVAMAPDGRILALAGRTDEPKGSKHGKPDWHLATDVWAPAASVFKLVTASALVESGVDPDDKIAYHGGIRSVVESNLKDDKRDNASESLTYGVAHSNNAIVGKLAYQHLEPSALDKLAHDLTALPGCSLPATGAELALPHDKSLAFAQAAAGFSGSRLSVLGGALLAATFADAGAQPVPYIIASAGGAADVKPASHHVLAEKTARAVAKMMVATCDFGSAAKSFRRAKVTVAGKTGTLATTTPFYMEHSWFVGYAPADKPQIVVSVLLGNPESWHLRGHEAARRLIDRALGEAKQVK